MKSNLSHLDINVVNVDNLNEESIQNLKLNNLILVIGDKKFILCRHLYKIFNVRGLKGNIKVDKSSYIKENEKFVTYLLTKCLEVKNNKMTLSSFVRIEQNLANFLLWINKNNIHIDYSIDNIKNTFFSYIDEFRKRYAEKELKIKPYAKVNGIAKVLADVYNTNNFYNITFDNNNNGYDYFRTNELSIDECIYREKNNIIVPLHNLILNVDGYRVFIFKFVYIDYFASRNGIFVNIKSYSETNLNFAKYMYEKIIIDKNNGSSSNSLHSKINNFFHILKWANDNKFIFNDSISNAKNIFQEYSIYLKQCYREGIYTKAQNEKHRSAHKMLKSIYNDDNNYILGDIRLISSSSNESTTVRSDEEESQYHYNFYSKIFNQITDFVLNKQNYPLRLDLVNNGYWCLPSSKKRYIEINSNNSIQAFDSSRGVIKKVEELMTQYQVNKYRAEKQVRMLDNSFRQNNTKYSRSRLELAKIAQKAFYMLFLSNTGMNDSNACTLEWRKEYNTNKNKVKFSAIKYRANGETVDFQIQSKFIISWKKYLLLRQYILQGKHFNHLFFEGYGNKAYLSKGQKLGSYSSYINNKFSKIFDVNLPKISSKILRVNKITKVAKNHGLIAATDIAQNSLSTLIRHYQGENKETTGIQLTDYFEQLNKSIFNNNDRINETAIGACASEIKYNHTDKNQKNFIDCSKKESCLFCRDYRLHADKKDLQKLYSLKYVINECKYIAKSENHFISVYGDVLKRIDNIEKQVLEDKKMTPNEMNLIKNEVFEKEILHPYWEHKLEMLLEIGVLK